MKIVDFICIGAQKAGTTAFYDLLKQHPQINLSDKKEIHFFDIQTNYDKGVSWYNSFFKKDQKDKIKGEFTPDYLLYNYVPKRIFESIGSDVKLIVMLRNPILRTYSQFNFHKMKGVEFKKDFNETIEKEVVDLENSDYYKWHDPPYYIARSLYSNQIKRYLEYFDKKNMHFIVYEELFSAKKNKVLDDLYNFLEIKSEILTDLPKSNETFVPKPTGLGKLLEFLKKNKYILTLLKAILPTTLYFKLRGDAVVKMQEKPNKLKEEDILKLNQKYFENDINELEVLISKDLSVWKK